MISQILPCQQAERFPSSKPFLPPTGLILAAKDTPVYLDPEKGSFFDRLMARLINPVIKLLTYFDTYFWNVIGNTNNDRKTEVTTS